MRNAKRQDENEERNVSNAISQVYDGGGAVLFAVEIAGKLSVAGEKSEKGEREKGTSLEQPWS